MNAPRRRVAVIGGGWAGLAAAVRATERGHAVTLFEASRFLGGRARSVGFTLPDGRALTLDNGQHIFVGAYTATLGLLRTVGVDEAAALHRLPLRVEYPDGSGIALPDWPAPWDVLAGIVTASGWIWADRFSLLRVAAGWRLSGFRCSAKATVADLVQGLTLRVRHTLIEPLCVAALNTPMTEASGAVFLRVLKDSLFAPGGGSNFLLAKVPAGELLPEPARRWLTARGADVRTGHRVQALAYASDGWQVDGETFDAVLLAAPPWEGARLVEALGPDAANWAHATNALRHEHITTVYAFAPGARLKAPLLALPDTAAGAGWFVFDRGQLDAPPGVLAFVLSASRGDTDALQAQAIEHGRRLLNLPDLQAIAAVTEKRATFACMPDVVRPPMAVAHALWACGDYVEGPYPATLEGAVRCGLAAADQL